MCVAWGRRKENCFDFEGEDCAYIEKSVLVSSKKERKSEREGGRRLCIY